MFSKDATLVRTRQGTDLYEFNFDFNICGIPIAQSYASICSHIDIINRYKVSLFVELGVFKAGTLPYIIPNLELDDDFEYIGFETNIQEVSPLVINYSGRNPRCHLILKDMWDYLDYVSDFINRAKRPVYIFCDGGNKPRELAAFSPLLRVGDVISIHDYADTQTGEIKDSDFACLGDSFVPLDEQWRKNILWLPTFMKVK